MNDQHVRKIAAGIALIVTPGLALASWLLWPVAPDTGAKFVADVARYSDARVRTALYLGVGAVAIGIVAIIAIVHTLHESRRVIGLIGGAFGIVGLAMFGVQTGVGIASFELSVAPFAQGARALLVQRLFDSDFATLLIIGGALMTLGFLMIAANLLVARVVPLPSAVMLGAFGVVQLVGYMTTNAPTLLAAYIVLCAALIPVGVDVLVESDEAWEHPPKFEGLRMIAGVPA